MKAIALAALALVACGQVQVEDDGLEQITGVVDVLAPGTRSETVIIEDYSTGEVFALVGELARELVSESGNVVSITGLLTEEGWSVRPDLRKIRVADYSVEEQEYGWEE